MKSLRVLAAASVVGLLVGGVALAAGTFTDDDGNVHEAYIEAIAAEGITRGCNPPVNDLYCPSEEVTRGQMAGFLARALGLDKVDANSFVDDDDSVFEGDIEALAAEGITRGCNPPANDEFCPEDSVTRGQMAAFLVRAFGYSDDGGGDIFTDDDDSVFEGEIDRLAKAGVTKGCDPPTNDRFCPDDLVLRDQMASFLARALGLSALPPPPKPTTTTTTAELDPPAPPVPQPSSPEKVVAVSGTLNCDGDGLKIAISIRNMTSTPRLLHQSGIAPGGPYGHVLIELPVGGTWIDGGEILTHRADMEEVYGGEGGFAHLVSGSLVEFYALLDSSDLESGLEQKLIPCP